MAATQSGDLPDYYFRLRENGASVFALGTENRQRRIEMTEIASVNLRNGTIKPHGDHVLTEAELAAIRDWVATRQAVQAARDLDDIRRTVDQLNLTAHWTQAKATPDQLEEVTDALLLAMHDLRSVLVRKKADRVLKAQAAEDEA